MPKVQTGIRRFLLVCAGLVFVSFAWIGAIAPGIPVTPFLICASYCFVRSSPRLHRWLLRSPFFGKFLHDWVTYRGIRKPIKILSISTVVIVVTCSITFSSLPIWVKIVISLLACIGITTILMLPTIPNSLSDSQKCPIEPTSQPSSLSPHSESPLQPSSLSTEKESPAEPNSMSCHSESISQHKE